MQKMTNELRSKIKNYIKSGIAIDELIKDIDIAGEDLSHAVINNFDRNYQNISGCRLIGAKIARANLIRTVARNVNFDYADLSNANCRYLDAVGSTFLRTNCMNTDFCGADLRSCNICDVTATLSARYFYKTKMSHNINDLFDSVWTRVSDNTTMQFTEPR